jgi:hypothetical protein
MSKTTKATKKELIALLTANYHELLTIFEMLPILKKHQNAEIKRETVVATLKQILSDYGVNPEDDSLYEVFKSDLSI